MTMSPMAKAVAVATTLWAVVLLMVVVMTVASSPLHDWRSGGGQHAALSAHMHGVQRDAMRTRSEYDYLAEMVPHHEEAITAARELRRSGRAELRELGAAIVSSQREQVRLMEGWLADWYPDRPASDPRYEPMMRDLRGLDGEALDRAFLTDMVPHHMMAVMSSQRMLAGGAVDHAEVADLAATIRDEQHAEIGLMRRWLSRLEDASVSGCRGAGRSTTGHSSHGPHPQR